MIIKIDYREKDLLTKIEQIKQNSNCLNDICTTDANGKRRKISKTAISKIIEFLRE